MDYTPPSPNGTPESARAVDSGRGGSLGRRFESTPGPADESTPVRAWKRKAPGEGPCHRRLADVLEACPGTPQGSSTLNDSLARHLEEFHMGAGEPAGKFFKGCDTDKLKAISAPTTPVKPIRPAARHTGSSFLRSFASASVNSPLKESHDILYPTLKPLEPKKTTPFKVKNTPAKRSFFVRGDPFPKVVSNQLIMANVFSNLSNGDIYRLSMVSKSLRVAVERDKEASGRYLTYVERHKKNKENYMITPPSSPEKEDDVPGGDSPRARRFKENFEVQKELTKNQTLIKCPACSKPSVVENSIAQCHNAFCGYIYCQKCGSCANSPEDFYDKCGNSVLLNVSSQSKRRTLDDLSNSTIDFEHSILSSSRYDSGIGSEYDSSHTPDRVRRNLNKSFGSKERARVLFDSNHLTRAQEKKTQRRSSIVPVVPKDERRIEVVEPSSPPRIKVAAACSKQSKRNLKRLTR